jgi:hypothetical protein
MATTQAPLSAAVHRYGKGGYCAFYAWTMLDITLDEARYTERIHPVFFVHTIERPPPTGEFMLRDVSEPGGVMWRHSLSRLARAFHTCMFKESFTATSKT